LQDIPQEYKGHIVQDSITQEYPELARGKEKPEILQTDKGAAEYAPVIVELGKGYIGTGQGNITKEKKEKHRREAHKDQDLVFLYFLPKTFFPDSFQSSLLIDN
jgi:hypothetical protein